MSAMFNLRSKQRDPLALRNWLADVADGNRPPGVVGYFVLLIVLITLSLSLAPVNVQLLDTMLIFAVAAIGLNVTLGYCGLVSVAQGAFVGIGAYTWALLSDRAHWNSLLAGLAALVICAVLGFAVGALATRIRTHYFLIVTIGLQVVFSVVADNATGWTGGSNGIPVASALHVGSWSATSPQAILQVTAIVFIVALYIANRLRRSRQGRGMVALLQSSQAAEASGVNAPRYRALGMAIGAAFGGIAGALFAPYVGYLSPDSFTITLSIELVVMIVIGGIGSNAGAVVGAVVLTWINQATEATLGMSTLILGLILMVLILIAPTGIVGLAQSALRPVLRGTALPVNLRRPWHRASGWPRFGAGPRIDLAKAPLPADHEHEHEQASAAEHPLADQLEASVEDRRDG